MKPLTSDFPKNLFQDQSRSSNYAFKRCATFLLPTDAKVVVPCRRGVKIKIKSRKDFRLFKCETNNARLQFQRSTSLDKID